MEPWSYAFQSDRFNLRPQEVSARWNAEALRLAEHLTLIDEVKLTSTVMGMRAFQGEFETRARSSFPYRGD
ncbi:MAG: hypothetical protein ACI87E_001415 [Mariniblastus sp.]|jgi:hypothetical protein